MSRPEPDYTIENLEAVPRAEFTEFTRNDALHLGLEALGVFREWELDLMVDVHIGDELAFRAQTGSTGQKNADVIVGKRAIATHFARPSLLVRLQSEADPSLLADFPEGTRVHGGCIPLFVGGAVAATLSTSGEPDVVDHQAGAEALRRFMA